jgi:integrase
VGAKLPRSQKAEGLGHANFCLFRQLHSLWPRGSHASRIKPTTRYKYETVLRIHLIPRIGSLRLQALRPKHIEMLYQGLLTEPGLNGRVLSSNSVNYVGTILKTALKYAVEVEGSLAQNPATKVKAPKSSTQGINPWTLSELNVFLAEAKSHRLYFFFRLSAFTGARRGELCALRWSDFDGKVITISKSRTQLEGIALEQNSTKGGKNGQRRVPLDPVTIEQFNSHRKRQMVERIKLGEQWHDTGYVFVQEDGLPLYPGTPSDLFKKILKKAGLRPTRLHDQRHLHATELLRLGEPLHVVADRLGHRDAMVTATIYAHVSSEQAETASTRFADATVEAM